MLPLMMMGSSLAADGKTPAKNTSIVYVALGEELSRYELDAAQATLTSARNAETAGESPVRGVPSLPVYPTRCRAMPVPAPSAPPATSTTSAFRIDPGSGALYPHGEAILLLERPIHMTVDHRGGHARGRTT